MAKQRTTKKKKTNLLSNKNVNNIHIKIGSKRRGPSRPAIAQQPPRGLYPSNNMITTVPQPHYQGTNVMELQQLIHEVREGNRVRANPAPPVQAHPDHNVAVQAHPVADVENQPLETF
jgi:hypothetical protein